MSQTLFMKQIDKLLSQLYNKKDICEKKVEDASNDGDMEKFDYFGLRLNQYKKAIIALQEIEDLEELLK